MSDVTNKFAQIVSGVFTHDDYNPRVRGQIEHLADQINANHQFTPEEALIQSLKQHFGIAKCNPNVEMQIRQSMAEALKLS